MRAFQEMARRLQVAFRAQLGAWTRHRAVVEPPINWTAPSLRVLLRRLGITVTLVTIVLPPVGYASLDMRELRKRATEYASLGARQVEVQLIKHRGENWLNEVSTNVLYGMRKADGAVVASWLTDKSGAALMFNGEKAVWPEVRGIATIKVDGFDGYFHIAVSTREVCLEVLWVSVFFLLLGVAAHRCFTRWPIAALDAASRVLEENQQALQQQKAELELHNMRFDAALNNMAQGLAMFDSGQGLIICNKLYAAMYGLTPEQVKPGTTVRQIFDYRLANGHYHIKDTDSFVGAWTDSFGARSSRIQELADGRIINVSRRQTPDGGRLVTHEDITERQRLNAQVERQNELLRQQEEKLRVQNLQLDAALGNMAQGLAMFDKELRIVIANDRYAQIYGFTPEQMAPGTTLHALFDHSIAKGDVVGRTADEGVRSLQQRVTGHKPAQYVTRLRNERTISVSIQPMADGGYVTTHEDVTDARRAEDQIAHMAMHDALTDLPNRLLLRTRLDKACGKATGGWLCSCSTSIGSRRSTTPSATPSAMRC